VHYPLSLAPVSISHACLEVGVQVSDPKGSKGGAVNISQEYWMMYGDPVELDERKVSPSGAVTDREN